MQNVTNENIMHRMQRKYSEVSDRDVIAAVRTCLRCVARRT